MKLNFGKVNIKAVTVIMTIVLQLVSLVPSKQCSETITVIIINFTLVEIAFRRSNTPNIMYTYVENEHKTYAIIFIYD